jgi:hypothetical protein
MMVISHEEAANALQQVGEAHDKAVLVERYRNASPFLILWGAIWMLADSLSDFYPRDVGLIWNTASLFGIAVSFAIGWRLGTTQRGGTRHYSWRLAATMAAVFAYFAATGAVLPQMTPLEIGEWISLFFGFAYVVVGIWAGWRILAVGAAMVVLILFGAFGLSSHQYLWLGLLSGGALLLGGFWLRKV